MLNHFLQGVPQKRKRCLMVSELDVRAAAWRKYGSFAQLEAGKQLAQQRAEQRRATWEQRQEEERAARAEELALRWAWDGGGKVCGAVRKVGAAHISRKVVGWLTDYARLR